MDSMCWIKAGRQLLGSSSNEVESDGDMWAGIQRKGTPAEVGNAGR